MPDDVTPEMRKQNAIMTLRSGEKIEGVLNDYNYDKGFFKFTSYDGKIYDNPELVFEVMDKWGYALLYEAHIKTINNKRFELELSNKSGDQISQDEISRGQQQYKPYDYELDNQKNTGSGKESNATGEVLQEPAQTENNQKSNFPLIISVNINGNHEWSYQNESIDRDVDMGFSAAFESYLIKEEGLKIGFGVEYMLKRDVKNNGGGIKFKSGYGIVKFSPGGNSGNLYLKGKYGFNIFTGDANYSSGLQSVIYGGKTMYGFGGELYFSPNTFVELMAITNMGEVIVLGGTFDIKYTYFNVGLGYSF